jgi:hypothetical protein
MIHHFTADLFLCISFLNSQFRAEQEVPGMWVMGEELKTKEECMGQDRVVEQAQLGLY